MRIIFKLTFIVFGLGLIAFMLFLDSQPEQFITQEQPEESPTIGDDEPSYIEENEEATGEEPEEKIMKEVEQVESEEVIADSQDGLSDGETVEIEHANPFHTLIGEASDELVSLYGEPDRVEPSQYGYEWFVWNRDDLYLQAGIQGGSIVTIYTNLPNNQTEPFEIGESYDHLASTWNFEREITITNDYQFNLSPKEIRTNPIIEVDGVWVQLYIDTFDQELSSIRYIDGDTVVLHQPYSLIYKGSLPEKPTLTESEWEQVEKGMARQVFDLTNHFRQKHGLDPLDWDEDTSAVAFGHSKDMRDNAYFSHHSPTHGDLGERLTNGGVQYQRAAENIAARYVDAGAAMEGWLNSEGHRVNLMNEDLTHLGVGVHRDFYTQNFMTPW